MGMGGKGGKSNPIFDAMNQTRTFVDPVDGTVFTDTPYQTATQGYSASNALNEHIKSRQAQDKVNADTAAQAATNTAAQKETDFQGRKGTAFNNALTDVRNAFSGAGVDPAAYEDRYIAPALRRQSDSIQDLDPNPSASFPTTLGQTIVNQATADRRQNALNQLNQTFKTGYAEGLIPDATSKMYVDQILGEQFDPLGVQLQNAQKRGTLTPEGYGAAVNALNQKRAAASDTITNLGRGIINTDRSAINDIIGGAKTDISNMNLADAFDPASYTTRAQTRAQSDLSNFGGALRSAVGGTQFASLSDLINAGGAIQGGVNPTPDNPNKLPGAATLGTEEDPNKKRGLGNTGAF